MRGQVILMIRFIEIYRITPADAGTSKIEAAPRTINGDHPRGCGDKVMAILTNAMSLGSPPRMRGQAHQKPFL